MRKFKEVLLVVNPISGNLEKESIIEKVEEKVVSKNASFYLLKTTGENDIELIRNEIKKNKIDRVLVAGGDGSINLVAKAVKQFKIPLGVIPAGSANGLAVNLNLPKQLDQQIDIALSTNFAELDILSLNDVICLHLSDLGINAELIRNYEDSNIRGKFGYLIQSVPTLIQSEYPFRFHIKTDKEEKEAEAVLLGVANARKYGTGATVNPRGFPNDGIFEIIIFKRLNIMEMLKTLRNEVELDPEYVEILSATTAKIKCKKPVAFQIDGEYIGKETEIDIKVLKEKLKIAVPEDF